MRVVALIALLLCLSVRPAGAQIVDVTPDRPDGGIGGGPIDLPVVSSSGITGLGGGGFIDQSNSSDPLTGGIGCGGAAVADADTTCTATATDGQTSTTGDDPAPPPPPTHAEIITRTCPTPPRPTIGTSPPDSGITGVETWIWSTGPHTATGSGTIRGYPVSCTLDAVRFDVDTSDPSAARYGHARTHSSTNPGSNSPTTDIRHLYETAGTYPLQLTITWQRTTTAGTDRTTTTASRPYRVDEVRSRPTTPPA